jgi:hypothetical protein
MFKIEAIILKVEKVRDAKIRLILFTREYGKISCWYNKKNFSFWIGDSITCYLERKESNNFLKNVDGKISAPLENWRYSTVIAFMEIISIFMRFIPEWAINEWAFDDYMSLLYWLKIWMNIEGHHYSLYHFRLLKSLGSLNPHQIQLSPVVHYIHEQIGWISINKLLAAKEMKESDREILQKITLKTLYSMNENVYI